MSDTDIDYQCARCGSSIDWEDCDACGGDGEYEIEDGDDQMQGWYDCDMCDGDGSWGRCLSTAEWCEANPRPGHEGIPRGTIETFVRRRAAAERTAKRTTR